MHQISEIWLEHQRRRWTRHDAHRWQRYDAERYRRFDPRFHRGSSTDAGKAYNPDQSREPAGSPEGGQWTSEEANIERPIPAQFNPQPRPPSIESLLRQGWRSLGDVAPGVSIIMSPGVRENEGYDAYARHITVSLTGIGEAIVIEEFGTEAIVSRYEVGTRASPDRGLSIRIDTAGNVFIAPTFGT